MDVNGLDPFRRVIPVGVPVPRSQGTGEGTAVHGEFQKLLETQVTEHRLKFSAHAQKRIEMSPVDFGDKELERVAKGVDLAESRGSKESVVLLDKMALVVSIKNRTVITAVDMERMKDNVFTNIDSAVIV